MYWRNRARQALSSFLLRHGYRYGGRSAWTVSYWRWLATLKLEHPAQQITMQEYILAIQEGDARHDRLVKQIEGIIPTWSMAPLVIALQAMRGVAMITRPPSLSLTSKVSCSKARVALSAWIVVIDPGWPVLTLRR